MIDFSALPTGSIVGLAVIGVTLVGPSPCACSAARIGIEVDLSSDGGDGGD